MIETEKIATNRYASPEAAGIVTYSFNGCEGLTIGQLVTAVCCRIGAALEAQSVVKTNIITAETDRLNAYSFIVSGLADGSVNYQTKLQTADYEGLTVIEFLMAEGCSFASDDKPLAGQLPKGVNSINNRLLAYEAIKDNLEKLANTSQQDMIDLQTDISRRDVAFSTATNAVRSLGASCMDTAGNF